VAVQEGLHLGQLIKQQPRQSHIQIRLAISIMSSVMFDWWLVQKSTEIKKFCKVNSLNCRQEVASCRTSINQHTSKCFPIFDLQSAAFGCIIIHHNF